MNQIVLREGISAKTQFENMGVDLSPLLDCIFNATGSDERRKCEFVGRDALVQHLGVEVDAVSGEWSLEVGPYDGVVDKGVWVVNFVEQLESVVEIAILREGAELKDSAHGIVIGGEAKADDLRVELLELVHGRT